MNRIKWFFMSGRKKLLYIILCARANEQRLHLENGVTLDFTKYRGGEWVKKYDKAPRYACSACNHLFNNKSYKYCPNCGAKMKGE